MLSPMTVASDGTDTVDAVPKLAGVLDGVAGGNAPPNKLFEEAVIIWAHLEPGRLAAVAGSGGMPVLGTGGGTLA